METRKRKRRTVRSVVKAAFPNFVLKRLRAVLVQRNRSSIRRKTKDSSRVVLQPINRVEHYFHFLLDLSLPLWHLANVMPSDTVFAIEKFGIFTDRLEVLFPQRIRIESEFSASDKAAALPLIGMNPQFVRLSEHDVQTFKDHLIQVLDLNQSIENNKVLLIERLPPNDYFKNQAVKKGAGASRRSIPNHDELSESIASKVNAPLSFHNVQLENITFAEQIRLFDQAAIVIAQHGAGLANCLFMRRNCLVIELTHDPSLQHFQAISKAKGHQHILFATQGSHERIDVDRFEKEVLRTISFQANKSLLNHQ